MTTPTLIIFNYPNKELRIVISRTVTLRFLIDLQCIYINIQHDVPGYIYSLIAVIGLISLEFPIDPCELGGNQ